MQTRRDFNRMLAGAAAAPSWAWPLAARAQPPKRPRIGVLSLYSAQDEGKLIEGFIEGLRTLGYAEGRNVEIDYRYAAGEAGRLKVLARELIGLQPHLAFATSASPVFAVKVAAPNLPIVCPQLGEVLIPNLAASFARPGGTLTGVAGSVEDLYGKLLELVLDALPGTVRVGFLANPAGASMARYAQQVETAARSRGVTVLTQEAHTPDDLARACDGFVKQQVQAVIVPANGLFVTHAARIAELAMAARLPTIFPDPRDVAAGGLASYGVNRRESYRRAADYVDRILKGTNPGDLPIEFPTKLVLVINLKTAKALGLTVPPMLLARADEVIE